MAQSLAVGLVAVITFAFHVRNLARRIPDDELADELQTVMLGFLAAAVREAARYASATHVG